jgi:alpha-L-rhamnosidase
MSDGGPTDFTVQTWDGAQWVRQIDMNGNSELYRWFPFPSAATTDRVRLVVTGAQNGLSRVVEPAP